jgi:hypothetical protein
MILFVAQDVHNLVSNIVKLFLKSDILQNTGSIVKIQKLDLGDKEI